MNPTSEKDMILSYFDKLQGIREKLESGTESVRPLKTEGILEEKLGLTIPEEGRSEPECWNGLSDAFNNVSVKWTHNNFFGYFPTTISPGAIVGTNLLNFNPKTVSNSPHDTKLEVDFCEKLVDTLKLPEKYKWNKGGIAMLCTTIGQSSLLLVHIAKSKKLKEIEKRNPELTIETILPKLVGYYPEYAHSHCIKALVLNGIVNTRKIGLVLNPQEKNFQMNLEALEASIKEDSEQGLIPFVCFGALGATSCCGCDDLEKLGEICRKNGALLAVDGAYSGTFLLPEKYNQLRESIKNADFYAINFAKMGYSGLQSAALFHSLKKEHFDTMGYDVEKDKDILPAHLRLSDETELGLHRLYFTFHTLGQKGFEELLLASEAAADLFRNLIGQDARFELFPLSKFALVCFRGVFKRTETMSLKESQDHIRTYNKKLAAKIEEDSRILLMGAEVNGEYFLRLSCKAPANLDEYRSVMAKLVAAYDQILATL